MGLAKLGGNANGDCPVTRPFRLIVGTQKCVASPHTPGAELTVLSVAADEPGPDAVTSPVSTVIALALPLTTAHPADPHTYCTLAVMSV